MTKRIFPLLLLLALVCHMVLPVSAQEVPDPEREGSISLAMNWNGEPVDGGRLTLYRVGDISQNDGNYGFVLMDGLPGGGQTPRSLNDPELAQALATAAREKALPAIAGAIENGKAVFSRLTPGLYLVTQGKTEASKGFAPILPFLISLPQWENDHYVYDLEANPKVPLEPKPTEPPRPTEPKPTGPKLPQTGQLNWPVPVLAASGLMLLVLGWLLRCGKRDRREA